MEKNQFEYNPFDCVLKTLRSIFLPPLIFATIAYSGYKVDEFFTKMLIQKTTGEKSYSIDKGYVFKRADTNRNGRLEYYELCSLGKDLEVITNGEYVAEGKLKKLIAKVPLSDYTDYKKRLGEENKKKFIQSIENSSW